MPTIVTERHASTDTETDKPMAIDKTLQICLKIEMFNLHKVGQGHGVQFLQIHHSMANIKMYTCLPQIFTLALNFSELYKFLMFNFQKIVQGHALTFSQLH